MYQPYNYYTGAPQFQPNQPLMQPQSWQNPISQSVQQPISQPDQNRAVGLQGRTVANISEITAQDLPMNGTPALFPLADGSAVYSRSWQGDGTVKTIEYRPVETEQKEQPTIGIADILSMQSDLSDIKSMLEKMNKPKATTRRKATDESDA